MKRASDVQNENVKIIKAETVDDIADIRTLFREYESFLAIDLDFQNFEAEIAALPGKYAFPEGSLLLVREGSNAIGCVGLRKFKDDICEMKRLYVKPRYQKQGLGRTLCMTIIRDAIKIGYTRMVLDTLDRLKTAMALYADLGFERTKPYYENPIPGVIYWAIDLNQVNYNGDYRM